MSKIMVCLFLSIFSTFCFAENAFKFSGYSVGETLSPEQLKALNKTTDNIYLIDNKTSQTKLYLFDKTSNVQKIEKVTPFEDEMACKKKQMATESFFKHVYDENKRAKTLSSNEDYYFVFNGHPYHSIFKCLKAAGRYALSVLIEDDNASLASNTPE